MGSVSDRKADLLLRAASHEASGVSHRKEVVLAIRGWEGSASDPWPCVAHRRLLGLMETLDVGQAGRAVPSLRYIASTSDPSLVERMAQK